MGVDRIFSVIEDIEEIRYFLSYGQKMISPQFECWFGKCPGLCKKKSGK